ncbi:MAG: TadE family protein [Candidatus Firestonebacteria bacterium]
MFKLRHNNIGQALLEFVMTIGLFILMWVGVSYFSYVFVVKSKLQMATRYGVWLLRDGEPSLSVKAKVRDFLFHTSPQLQAGTILTNSVISIDTSYAKADNYYPDFNRVVKIKYLILPRKILGIPTLPVYLSEKCIVASDTWHYGIPGSNSVFKK